MLIGNLLKAINCVARTIHSQSQSIPQLARAFGYARIIEEIDSNKCVGRAEKDMEFYKLTSVNKNMINDFDSKHIGYLPEPHSFKESRNHPIVNLLKSKPNNRQNMKMITDRTVNIKYNSNGRFYLLVRIPKEEVSDVPLSDLAVKFIDKPKTFIYYDNSEMKKDCGYVDDTFILMDSSIDGPKKANSEDQVVESDNKNKNYDDDADDEEDYVTRNIKDVISDSLITKKRQYHSNDYKNDYDRDQAVENHLYRKDHSSHFDKSTSEVQRYGTFHGDIHQDKGFFCSFDDFFGGDGDCGGGDDN